MIDPTTLPMWQQIILLFMCVGAFGVCGLVVGKFRGR